MVHEACARLEPALRRRQKERLWADASCGCSGRVCWEQVHWAKDDAEGRPVLVVHLHAALRQDAAGAKRAAEAILTHMEYALQQRMRDDLSGPEQVVVVLDSRGAPTLQVGLAPLPDLYRLRESLHVLVPQLDPSIIHMPLAGRAQIVTIGWQEVSQKQDESSLAFPSC